MGPSRRRRRACWPRTSGRRWTYAGDARGARTAVAGADARRVPRAGRSRAATADLRRGRPSRRAIRCRRRCTTPRSRPPASTPSTCRWRPPTSTTSSPSPRAFDVRGASVTAPFKLGRLAGRGRDRRRWRPPRRRQHAAAARPAAGRAATPTSRASWRRSPDATCAARRVAVLGAGGAARAVAAALAGRAARASPSTPGAPTPPRAVGRRAPASTAGAVAAGRRRWDLLVNTTPVGTDAATSTRVPLALDGAARRPARLRPRLQPAGDGAAARAPARSAPTTIGGLPMLVAQAAAQFAWWTGHTPSRPR